MKEISRRKRRGDEGTDVRRMNVRKRRGKNDKKDEEEEVKI